MSPLPWSMPASDQLELSLLNIFLFTSLQTGLWLWLWFGPRRPMRTRQWQTGWQLGGYAVLWSLGVSGMANEGLLFVFGRIERVWSHPPIVSMLSKAYFEVEVAWYASQLLTLVVHRDLKDWTVMFVHHLITPGEIFFSYSCGYAAIGMVIMFLHDTSDVCLHLAKAFHHARWKALTDFMFVLFAAFFLLTRLILLPMCPHAYFTGNSSHQSYCGHALAGTCSVLVVLHIYWFYLIVRMIVRFATAGEVEGDIREKEVETEMLKVKSNTVSSKQAHVRRSNGHSKLNSSHIN